uniref:DNA alkylation repair enzyme n=1 Tax=uncultured Thiotrichaceae bacterium TaxID=298394 RepID=A0A6S6TYL0_9GAMM|nr:MAG: DNA alkylation repair enzyme [uncultured Thiotrichaceae bacterium]
MEPFKNVFSAELVTCFANHLQQHLAGFDRERFEQAILPQLETLELKGRAQLLSDQIYAVLPVNQSERHAVLYALLHPEEFDNEGGSSDEKGIRGWGIFPLTLLVGQYELKNFEASMMLLKAMTKRFTSEFGIRYLLLEDQGKALAILEQWLDDPNHHVRRLISEGTRPRLPWGQQLPQLIADPAPMLPLLEALRADSEEYVRRSVANHLNDIAKDHPDLIAQLANEWMVGADKQRERLVRHACRSLIKQGHPLALKAFGVEEPQLEVTGLQLTPDVVKLGSPATITAELHSTSDKEQTIVIDYLLHLKKANGKLAPKVFKGSKTVLAAGQTYCFKKNHTIKAITTRRYYAGEQGVSLRINGQDYGYVAFELLM